MAIEYTEMDGFPKETKSFDGFEATRKLKVKWNDRKALRNLLLTWPRQLYPYGDSFNARAQSVAIEGFGQQTQDDLGTDLAWYEWALMTVKYKSPSLADEQENPNASSDQAQAISEEISPTVETIPLDHTIFEWNTAVDGSKAMKPDEAPVWPINRAIYSITRYHQPSIPTQLISYVGSINDAAISPILFNNLTYAEGTLLYQPASIRSKYDRDPVTGVMTRTFDITYRFSYKEETWWQFWRSDLQAYDTIKVKSTNTQYQVPFKKDFSLILPTGS